jgi:isopentenyldiphosphate isomerase
MEILDVVNDKDEVVGEALIKDIYEKKLLHRIVHILIFDKKGKMALHLRSKHKSFCPEHWSTPVGGHVQKGETYERAALREFQEELGIKRKVEFAYKDFYSDKLGNKKFLTTFKAVYEGPFKINPEEVEKIEFFSLEKIRGMIQKGEKFHPELLFLLRKHFNIG